jgi:hypothetical protein
MPGGQLQMMPFAKKDCYSVYAFRYAAIPILIFAVALIAIFLLLFGHTSVWFDEANYLQISRELSITGYPFWPDVDKPRLFLDSPPGLLYAISFINGVVGDNLFFLRIVYSVTCVAIPFIALFLYIRMTNLGLLLLSVTLLFCSMTFYYIRELVQIRMDLPLAALSFVALLLVATWEEQSQHRESASKWVTLGVLCGISALAFFTKYQAVCLTGTLGLYTVFRNPRLLASWLPLIAHLFGAAIGILAVVILVKPGVAALLLYVFEMVDIHGVLKVNSLIDERGHWSVFKKIIPMVAVPAVVFKIVNCKSRNWKNEPLLLLCVLMVLVVIAFNLAVHRGPGAGHYYMTQAALPLGYIYAWSFNCVFHARRVGAIAAMVAALAFHSIINVNVAGGSPQRWGYGWMDLVGPGGRLDQAKLVAASLAPSLGPDEVLLLDDWGYQNAAVPYWLNRVRYRYLNTMDPIRVEKLLEQKGPHRVGAVIFRGQDTHTLLRRPEWAEVDALLSREFVRLQVENAPDWIIYVPRAERVSP